MLSAADLAAWREKRAAWEQQTKDVRAKMAESQATRDLYGLDTEVTGKFGANCLLARLVERGGWDAHTDLGAHAVQ